MRVLGALGLISAGVTMIAVSLGGLEPAFVGAIGLAVFWLGGLVGHDALDRRDVERPYWS